jgi:hypothetical protein
MTSKNRFRCLLVFISVAALVATVSLLSSVSQADENPYEVWLVDQSNCNGLSYGGKIHIYSGQDLEGLDAQSPPPLAETIDLCGATSAMALAKTGANPVRPHMLLFNSDGSRAILAFVASGHVVIFDTETRTPIEVVRTSPGAGGARQAHAAFPAPDGSYILVANQNGKLLERIDTDYAAGTYTLNQAATIDLAACTTPNGLPCQDPLLRPDNAPICPIVDGTGDLAFVTLRGGGLFVVDARTTPMQIVGEYDTGTVRGNGCGGAQAGESMFINSGGGTPQNLHEFDLYRFPLSGYSPSNPPNTPAPQVIFADHAPERDSHGMVVTKGERYLWVLDRARNVAEVFDVASGTRTNTVDLRSDQNADPTPDLGVLSPSGHRIFVSLRGPNPLSGDSHVSTGARPGLGVIRIGEAGRSGVVKSVVPISNVDVGGVERGDAHAIGLRLK